MKAVTSHVMSEIDRRATKDFGVPALTLMENAGRCVAEDIIAGAAAVLNKQIAVFCGKGNNGGDGFVAARYLADVSSTKIVIFAPAKEPIEKNPAGINRLVAKRMGMAIRPFSDFLSGKYDAFFAIAVDALLGTGFKGTLSGEYEDLCRKINSSCPKRYAVDVPSGLDATSGRAAENCVRAHTTITFGLPKTGFYLADGPRVCGDVVVRDIGFPRALIEEYSRE